MLDILACYFIVKWLNTCLLFPVNIWKTVADRPESHISRVYPLHGVECRFWRLRLPSHIHSLPCCLHIINPIMLPTGRIHYQHRPITSLRPVYRYYIILTSSLSHYLSTCLLLSTFMDLWTVHLSRKNKIFVEIKGAVQFMSKERPICR